MRCYGNCNKSCDKGLYIGCSDQLLRSAQVYNGTPGMKNCHKRKLVYVI